MINSKKTCFSVIIEIVEAYAVTKRKQNNNRMDLEFL